LAENLTDGIENGLNQILNTLPPSEIWVCSTCGSPDIEEKQWVNLNTKKNCGGTDEYEYYCNKCSTIVENVTMLDKFEKNKLKKKPVHPDFL